MSTWATRLTEKELRAEVDRCHKLMALRAREMADMSVNNRRLREALRSITTMNPEQDGYSMQDIARNALTIGGRS